MNLKRNEKLKDRALETPGLIVWEEEDSSGKGTKK